MKRPPRGSADLTKLPCGGACHVVVPSLGRSDEITYLVGKAPVLAPYLLLGD
jgi:hypothetical protein